MTEALSFLCISVGIILGFVTLALTGSEWAGLVGVVTGNFLMLGVLTLIFGR